MNLNSISWGGPPIESMRDKRIVPDGELSDSDDEDDRRNIHDNKSLDTSMDVDQTTAMTSS